MPAVVLAVLAFLAAWPASAQTSDQAALTALAGPLYQELAGIKGMASPGPPPPILIKSREDTRRFIQKELDRRYPPAQLEAERKGLVAWGLIPADYDLRRLFVDLMEEQIAAYYDPVAKVMVVGDWLPPEQQQAALMHELVHALQDHQMSLEKFISPQTGQGDQILARQALIEGEAVAIMLVLLLKSQGADLSALPDLGAVRSMIAAGTLGPVVAAAPKFLRDLLVFPYVDGLNFMYEFNKRQPWSAMPTLYRDPPRSTAQILDPEQRLGKRQDPISIGLPDLGVLAPGVKVLTEDELGAFTLGAVLEAQLGEQAARLGARSWRGDRYRVWEDADGRLVIAYLVAMQDDATAAAFAHTYAKVIERRQPALAGRGASSAGGALTAWRDGNRVFVVERHGPEVLVLQQMPSAAVDAARDAIWRARAGAAKP